jgi:hypothetical protein
MKIISRMMIGIGMPSSQSRIGPMGSSYVITQRAELFPRVFRLRRIAAHKAKKQARVPVSGTRLFLRRLNSAFERPSKERLMKKILLGAVLLAAATPAFAAEFFIVRDSATKKCTIVDKRPTVTTTTVVSGDHAYTTREEATTAMKTVKVCHD